MRVESRYLAVMKRPGIRTWLLEVLYGGWLDGNLWEAYGNIVDPENYKIDDNTERRLYVHVAGLVLKAMNIGGALSRSGTHYRVASALVHELAGAQTHACKDCNGKGYCSWRDRAGKSCKKCRGTGVIKPSTTTRAEACMCRLPEFRDNLQGPYLTVLSFLRRELEIALAEYRRISAHAPLASLVLS